MVFRLVRVFLITCLLFLGSLLYITINLWSPSPWRAVTSLRSAQTPAPQRYVLDNVELYIVWIDQTPLALSTETPTELGVGGCRVRWDGQDQLFVDPCGGSRFFSDGSYKYGPAPRGLSSLPARIVEDQLEIDPTRIELGVPHP
jgi:hypothetical protein